MTPSPLLLRRLLTAGNGPTDEHLLNRYLNERDELAFEMLVHRHGPMVLGVCRRVLGNQHDAEDAFQATFFVLARRASQASSERLGPWLHGIALRTALKARVAATRRHTHETRAAGQRPLLFAPPAPMGDIGAVLDEELSRLPAEQRTAFLMCDVQGLTRRQAARHLGWAESTLSSRLTAARERLARQLSRRGITLSLAGLTAAVSGSLAAETTRMALHSSALPATVAALTQEVISAMTVSRKTLIAVLVVLAGLLGGALVPAAGERGAASSTASAREDKQERRSLDRFRFLAFDGFDGRFGLNWKPIRPDPTHYSLAKNPGRLTITTQRGSIHGPNLPAGKKPGEGLTKNIFVIDNPLARNADFIVTTLVVHFKPAKPYQQAGLILYNDDDHYLKWTYEFNDDFVKDAVSKRDLGAGFADLDSDGLLDLEVADAKKDKARRQLAGWLRRRAEKKDLKAQRDAAWRQYLRLEEEEAAVRQSAGRPFFIAVSETEGMPTHHIAAEAKPNLPRVWLQIRKRGNLYDCLTSTDGERFVLRGTVDWGKGGPKQIGLIAQNGREPGVPDIDAQFEFFQLRSP
jgi:RNA polymerase sigma factor (sigma-70 family)